MRYGFADKQKQIQRQNQKAGANKAGEYLMKTADGEAGLSGRYKSDMSPPER